jgi:hypothetical protein
MASGTLWLPARTRGSGENCRGPRRASPGEESVAREREKKGRHGSDWMTPFLQGGHGRARVGGGSGGRGA